MAFTRLKYFAKNYKSHNRQYQATPTGVIACVCSFVALALLAISIIISYKMNGEGSSIVGALGMIALIFSGGSIALAIASLMEGDVRPVAPKTGLVLGIVVTIILLVLLIGGVR